MLDDDDGVSKIDESMEDVEELADVIEVQPRGGFIEEVESLSCVVVGQPAASLTR